MKKQCLYFIDKTAFPTFEDRDNVLRELPKRIKVYHNPIIMNCRMQIYPKLWKQYLIDREIRGDLYWISILEYEYEA